MKIDIIISGDSHYDLKTDGIDRTDDIHDAKMQIIDYAIKLKEDGKEVLFLDMGDVFHGTRPRANSLAKAIEAYRRLDEARIRTIVIDGNHDVIDAKGATSALEPILAIGFKYVYIIHDIELVSNWYGDRSFYRGLNIVCLPHISKARAIEAGYKNVQQYIDEKSNEINELLKEDETNITIAHLNIAGAKTGTEIYMIKGAHEDFPEVIKKSDKIKYIFNGHIHRPQRIKNLDGAPIFITGDIQCNDFGERLDTKIFFHLEEEI